MIWKRPGGSLKSDSSEGCKARSRLELEAGAAKGKRVPVPVFLRLTGGLIAKTKSEIDHGRQHYRLSTCMNSSLTLTLSTQTNEGTY